MSRPSHLFVHTDHRLATPLVMLTLLVTARRPQCGHQRGRESEGTRLETVVRRQDIEELEVVTIWR